MDVSKPVKAVRLRNSRDAADRGSDKAAVRLKMPELMQGNDEHSLGDADEGCFAEEPARLVQTLTGAILGCGGWVLSRGANDTGTMNMLFEFERQACVDIYSVLIAAGLELSQSGHIRFTELCQCTRSHQQDCGTEIASIDLEIQTFPVEMHERRCKLQKTSAKCGRAGSRGLTARKANRLIKVSRPRPVRNGAARLL